MRPLETNALGRRLFASMQRWALRVDTLARRGGHDLRPSLRLIRPVHMAAAFLVCCLLALALWERCGLAACPDVAILAAYQPDGGALVLDREDREITVLRPVRHEVVPLADLPPHLAQAFIAMEDRRFYRHNGIDWRRVLGAAVANLHAGRIQQGASTITMQLARNAFPDHLPATERSPRRKLLEARVARDIEARFTKDEILELYLNHIYFGGGAQGIEAAGRYYFGRPATELTLAQAAMLAGILRAPSHYDARRNPDGARQRRNLVITALQTQGVIDAETAERTRGTPLDVVDEPPFRGREPARAAYFTDEVRRLLEERLGERLYTSRVRIHTTLDLTAHEAAEEELARQLESIERGTHGRFRGARFADAQGGGPAGSAYLQGAVVMLDVKTGDVLALVGGRDHRSSSFNRALRSRRQAGSAFKPFVYATALARGHYASQLVADEPVRVRLAGNRTWEPENYDGGYYGVISMRHALVQSRNVPTVRLAAALGEPAIASTARAAGVHSDIPETPAMALGSASITPLELTTAYATFASLGEAVTPRLVRRVEAADGTVLWRQPIEARPALDPAVAYVLTDMLRDVVNYGTGYAVRASGFHGLAAGKTGTTNDGRDVWFVGYTPDIVAGVWIGFDRPTTILANATGGRLAAPVWGRMMRRVYQERPPPRDWRAPGDIVARRIDPWSGLPLADGCWPRYGEAEREIFIHDLLPQSVCPRRGYDRGWIRSVLDAFGLREREAHIGSDRSRDERRRSPRPPRGGRRH